MFEKSCVNMNCRTSTQRTKQDNMIDSSISVKFATTRKVVAIWSHETPHKGQYKSI